ncbi:MAG TPA: YcnI family protein [Jatrophihabitans sp.]|nr:YcnI family protein [Jatrophihabitans sp.]
MHSGRRLRTITLTLLGLFGAGLCWATAAAAHVTVAAPGVTAGASDATITVRVPDESGTASTTGLKLQLPTDHPLPGVLVAPLPGWTATVKNTKLATPLKTDDGDISEVVSEIDWQAAPGAGIKPGYFGQFSFIAGKLPDGVHSLTFKAIQSYSDASSVSWIEQAAPGSSVEPEHPAPVLQLAGGTAATDPAVPAGHSSDGSGKATAGIMLGILGILLGGAALLLVLLRGRPGGAG